MCEAVFARSGATKQSPEIAFNARGLNKLLTFVIIYKLTFLDRK
jgi:hypothetical protein